MLKVLNNETYSLKLHIMLKRRVQNDYYQEVENFNYFNNFNDNFVGLCNLASGLFNDIVFLKKFTNFFQNILTYLYKCLYNIYRGFITFILEYNFKKRGNL